MKKHATQTARTTTQTTLEFFHEAPQTYYCLRCGDFHKAGECPNKEAEKEQWPTTT